MIIVELTWIKNASLENIDKFINTMYFYVDFFFDEKNLKVKRERGKRNLTNFVEKVKRKRIDGSYPFLLLFYFFVFTRDFIHEGEGYAFYF